MIVPPILPRGTVVTEMRNEPYHCHQSWHPVDDQPLLGVLPQLHEKGSLIQRYQRFALPHHLRIVVEFHVDAL